ncbi:MULTISPECIES: SurA N-terminal domain-containing protein [Streptomyces]|uniref:SurA N-terminal domain-containing protein n=1 Tax=Streptomyces sudanensis TaxID=436397 RepID=A0ABY4TBR4_9ACTN|nr:MULTISPECIES: SurA N-terminal domain-containing protein [Streptomyces]MCP9958690.1 SurA N-terminal domain-containing protein [Streptomyces sudanensis]MCP9987780.1 SurA N-terminal domain-containing protein [Streptomyces sudanensis]MCQ0000816.1 SurA N-terminal domain-containing protein [Streptomyces sudanensis]URN16399.1 SurA N-terminal domain-containing protein [Streptomyces sudanensis]
MHRRRRTALSVSAALLAAAPLLTACGGDAHPGAAAVVGGDRIETAALQAQVRQVRSAQEASPQAEQLIRATGTLSREKLNGMIFDRVVEKVAADAGVTASRKEVQETRRAAARQYGGEAQLAAMLLQQQGTTPGEVDGMVRRGILMDKIAAKHGVSHTPEGQKKLAALFGAASRDLAVEVNPRYGTWDHDGIRLGDHQPPWLRQVTRDPAATPAGA